MYPSDIPQGPVYMIDGVRTERIGYFDDGRRTRHHRATIKAHRMAAAVAITQKIFAVALPGNFSGVGSQGMFLSTSDKKFPKRAGRVAGFFFRDEMPRHHGVA